MGIANDCYNPNTFKPGNTSLLSLGQWQMLQLYLVDASNLNLTSAQMPYPDVLAIYKKLHCQAVAFHGNTLPQAHSMGNKLYNYGTTASLSFKAVVELMADPTPDKTAIVQLLGSLQSTAATYQADSLKIFNAISTYISDTNGDVTALQAAVKRETAKAGADQSTIEELQTQYQAKFADKQIAQSKIVSDQHAINDTKYYSWIPFVGTGVAVGEIIAKEKDIKTQLERINADVAAMQSIQGRIQGLRKEIAQLTYTAQYNTHMANEVSNAMTGLNLIKGAWGTIVSELGDVIENANLASASALKNQKCLAGVYLTTAADEWEQVASDANSFQLNFYIQPKSQAA
ncbi:MAG: hypothetical protein HQ518_21020 [Rhodopirellula sp.]|nr:hypothetical protein [Rhodopirellula sp.]